jgi:DNA-binding LacI/PurR family transcriptional regulator
MHAAAAPRLAGILDALGTWGLSRRRLAIAEGDGHVAGGERAMSDLLARSPDVTGVVCYNDLTAIGALRALRAHEQRVPEDVSVVGFDDLDLAAYVDPPLTTVAQDTTTMGRWALQRVVGLIRGEPADVSRAAGATVVRLPVRLVDRRSAGPVAVAEPTRSAAG